MRILVVEDDGVVREALKKGLGKEGYEVITASNGLEALKILEKEDAPKFVIVDWIMPEMDGIELIRRIRSTNSSLPPYIIMLTCRSEKTDIITALQTGADDYLTKPFDLSELKARINVGRRILDMQEALYRKVKELNRALAEIKTLRGILPICAGCKKIKNDRGEWIPVEVYIRDRTEAEFSHGLCPECVKKFFANVEK